MGIYVKLLVVVYVCQSSSNSEGGVVLIIKVVTYEGNITIKITTLVLL